jgi:FMN-dependent oxidoreductase (nitrilotriacetate monooxygenase family)
MHLIAYLKTGPTALHSGGWRHPEARLDDIFDPLRYEQMAQTLEAAKFDAAFFADLFGLADTYKGSFETFVRSGGQNSYLDPMTVLPIMARATTRLGLGATVSTSFYNAFHLARSLGSIDMLSKGRVAWNVVTSTNDLEARNAGFDHMPPHDERYERAEEVLEACFALWNTWDPDAFVLDKHSAIFADPAKVHYANYEGRWTKTRGPLPTPRSPQGRPVIMQAGSSERGRQFAARWAEIIFTSETDKQTLHNFCQDMRRRLTEAGRDPGSCKILPGVTPILGETLSIAKERADFLDSLQDPEYDLAYASLSVGADLSKHKTPEEIAKARGTQGTHGTEALLKERAQKEGITFVEAGAKRRRDPAMIGTPAMVADALQDVFESGGCDGFVVMPATLPTSHEQFCRAVVPELQRRKLFRTEYSASTLRGNLFD